MSRGRKYAKKYFDSVNYNNNNNKHETSRIKIILHTGFGSSEMNFLTKVNSLKIFI